jgi:RNA polymerase sigma-70 factor (ECF subfamily)
VTDDAHTRLGTLHESLAVDLLNYFIRRVEQREDAADLLAETFLVAWRNIGRLPKESEAARMWMFVTARNVHRNYLRGARRRERLSDRLRLDLRTVTPEATSDEQLDIRAAVRALPDGQRELVMLMHWEAFSLPDAARIAGIPESTARGRYQRARIALRARLTTEETTTHV